MRQWIRACGAALAVGIAAAAGCGGNVLVDGTGGGEGGQGGTGSGPTGPTGVTNGPTTQTSVSATSVTTGVSTGSEMSTGSWTAPLCDNQGNCGSFEEGCIGCALAGPCADSYDVCLGEPECSDYSNCVNECGGEESCYGKCTESFPIGAQLYTEMVVCVICNECYVDCDGPGSGCP